MSLFLSLVAGATLTSPSVPADPAGLLRRHAAPLLQAQDPKDPGDVVVDYGPIPKDKAFQKLREGLKEGKMLEKIAQSVNETFNLPEDIVLGFAEIGQANAFYSPKHRTIVVGWELWTNLMDTYAQEGRALEGDTNRILNGIHFIIYHEMGHALVDVLKIPVTGREEDAVDQFSLWMLRYDSKKAGLRDGGYVAVDAAEWFALSAGEGIWRSQFWDTHSLSQQRFYDILTLVHGGDPERFNFLVKKGMLPDERAAYSTEEWNKICNAWNKLLGAYAKTVK